ncbi:MAG: NAD(P)-dependent oxidoreductase [Planctomycetes bacterium]|nr:NAD(P)-dependent oxidoreductase [Planctomycetota bacterium]
MPRALVLLGPTGVRGRALLRAHARDGGDLRVLALSRRQVSGLDVVPGDVRAVPEALLARAGDEHVVVHLAVKQVDTDGTGFEETNVRALERLLRRLDPARCRGLVYASSASVYGRGPLRAVTEDAPLRPATPLARSRAAAEGLALAWGRAHGVGVRVVRTRFVIGPGDPALRALAARSVLPGTGAQRLSLITADDLGQSLLSLARGLLERPPTQEALNLSLTYAPPLADALGAVAPRRRRWLPVPRRALALAERALPGAWLDRLDLLAHDQTLACDRAVERHGLAHLARTPEETLARLREAVA